MPVTVPTRIGVWILYDPGSLPAWSEVVPRVPGPTKYHKEDYAIHIFHHHCLRHRQKDAENCCPLQCDAHTDKHRCTIILTLLTSSCGQIFTYLLPSFHSLFLVNIILTLSPDG